MRKNIAVVAGGFSGEALISYQSGTAIINSIDSEKYDVYLIKITKQNWFYEDNNMKVFLIDRNDFSLTIDNTKILFDGVFIAIHGTPGEDGKIQGYFDMIGIPYNTCTSIVSSLTFNKNLCKKVVASFGVNTARSLHFYKQDKIDLLLIKKELKFPLFIKPSNGGSSIGMSKVDDAKQLKQAIKKAFDEDDEILIEEYIKGIELTCGIIQSKNKMIVFPITQIVPIGRPFFDYEAKYLDQSNEITPAPVDIEIENKCKSLSAFLYKKLDCRGICRFDYIYSNDKFYFLEVNTVPGQTNKSIVPQQALSMGISQKELCQMSIDDMIN